MASLIWGWVVVLAYIPLVAWLLKRRRLPLMTDMRDSELRRLYPRVATLWMLTGIFWGSTLWYASYVVFALLTGGSHSIMPRWFPPQAVFVPLMLG
jgi:hypothetical protein